MADRTPVSPCCVDSNFHGQPGCVWPSETPPDDVLLALGRAVWEALRDPDEMYAHLAPADSNLRVDGHVPLPDGVVAIVRLAPAVQP